MKTKKKKKHITMDSGHDCKIKNCDGALFQGEYLRCNLCKNAVFIECMSKSEFTRELFCTFELIDSRGSVNKGNIDNIMKRLKRFFDLSSPFAITCMTCRKHFVENAVTQSQMESEIRKNNEKSVEISTQKAEILRLSNELDNLKAELNGLRTTNAEIDNGAPAITSDPAKDLKKPTTSPSQVNKSVENPNLMGIEQIINAKIESLKSDLRNILLPNKITKDLKGTSTPDDFFRIYVSSNDSNTTEDEISDLIIGECDIVSDDSFKVKQLMTLELATKRRHQSFEIITLSQKLKDKLLDVDIWPADYKVRLFKNKVLNRTKRKGDRVKSRFDNGNQKNSYSRSNRNPNFERNQRQHRFHRANQQRKNYQRPYNRRVDSRRNNWQNNQQNNRQSYVRDGHSNLWQNQFHYQQQFGPFWQQPHHFPPYMIPVQQQHQQMPQQFHPHMHAHHSQPSFHYQHQ